MRSVGVTDWRGGWDGFNNVGLTDRPGDVQNGKIAAQYRAVLWGLVVILVVGAYSGLVVVWQEGKYDRARIELQSEKGRTEIERRIGERYAEIIRRLERIEEKVR